MIGGKNTIQGDRGPIFEPSELMLETESETETMNVDISNQQQSNSDTSKIA